MTIAWIAFLAAACALVFGHLGASRLDWMANQISTYAAVAPNRAWVKAGMLLAALGLIALGMAISFRPAPAGHVFDQLLSMTSGVAASGLLLLAHFEETARSANELTKMSFAAIRQQTFHDAGLLLFFYGAAAILVASGTALVIRAGSWSSRALGLTIAATAPVAFGALTSSWPKYFGLGGGVGLKQRAAFFSLYLGVLLLLAGLGKVKQRT